MARTRLWVGLDVGADEMAVCCMDDLGNVSFECAVPTTIAALDPLLRPQKRRIKLIGLEAGTYGTRLTHSLRKHGYRVAVFDTLRTSKFLAIRQNKTDKNDARGLADVARLGRASVSEVRLKSPECQRLRSTLVMRRRLIDVRMSLESTMRSLFRINGGRLPASSSAAALRKNVQGELVRLRRSYKVDLAKDVEPLLTLSEATRKYVEGLDRSLTIVARENPVCCRFMDIPGVGPMCALAFYTAVEDPTRFCRNADIGAYLGMVPRVRQSGQSTARVRISKRGDAMARSYLCQAALGHLRYGQSAVAEWGTALHDRLGGRRAQIAVARKLAVIMLAMWKSGADYEPMRGHSPGRMDAQADTDSLTSLGERQA
jgi:transposase